MKRKINLSFQGKNSDYLNYCPFRLGLKRSELGLRKLQENTIHLDRENTFQFDPLFMDHYRKSKEKMRSLYPDEDYKHNLSQEELKVAFNYMGKRLALEYPKRFQFSENKLILLETKECFSWGEQHDSYRDGIDFLAFHIQEDFCFVDAKTLKTRLVHLLSPNDWTAKWGIDKNFDEIHIHIPRAKEIVKRPEQVFNRIFKSGLRYERLGAMTLTSYPYLLRHPDHKETFIKEETPYFYFRFERQTLAAIEGSDLLLFTIRPYLMDFTKEIKNQIDPSELREVLSGVHQSRYTWFFKDNEEYFKNYLSTT